MRLLEDPEHCLDATVAGFVEQTSVAAVEERLGMLDFGDAARAFAPVTGLTGTL